jgi:hypothetical protein
MTTSCLAAAESKRRFWSSMLACAFVGAAMSTASSPAMADEATSEALFQAAKGLMDQKKYAEACPKFEASYKLDPATGTKLNLADCHEKEGKLARAWGEWGEARDQAKRENDKARMDLAIRRQKELDPRVPKLTVKVTGPVTGIAVYRDELQLDPATFGVPLPVDPGDHVVTLRRGTSVLRDKKITVKEKTTEELTIDATGIPAAPPEPDKGTSGSTNSVVTGPDGQPVMVRRSRGMIAGGIILASFGGLFGLTGLGLTLWGALDGRGGTAAGGVFLLALGTAGTWGGIVMADKGMQKVPKKASKVFTIPPPSVFIGPGSIMVQGHF